MEFKLNKIDTDIRKKIQEETKEDKVHSGKNINIKQDIKDEKSKNYENEETLSEEKQDKRYITINGVKYQGEKINIKAEKVQEINEETSKGRMLDAKK